jgi:hypothetical protein
MGKYLDLARRIEHHTDDPSAESSPAVVASAVVPVSSDGDGSSLDSRTTLTTLTTKAPLAGPVAVRCFACRGFRFWRSIHGAVVCGICHPPAAPELVREWIAADASR